MVSLRSGTKSVILMRRASKPEFWALIISAVALVVSGLTWWDVRKQLHVAIGQARSYVQVVDASLTTPLADTHLVEVALKVKNLGPTGATDVHGEMDYRIGMPDPHGKGNSATRRPLGAMGPGMERTITLKSNRYQREDWPTPSLHRYQTVYFYGSIKYTDETTEEPRKDDWCYALPLRSEADLKSTLLEPCGIFTYVSEDSAE